MRRCFQHLCFFWFVLLVAAGWGHPAETAAQATTAGAGEPSTDFLGVRRCRLCHDRGVDDAGRDDELNLTEFVQLNEYRTWRDHDAHSRAFAVLEGPLGKQMGETLGINPSIEQQCLICHTTLYHRRMPPEDRVAELRLGVACESCHGPSRNWFVAHMEPSWREKSTAEKESLGMVDMRHPASRAKRCLSCHFGRAEEGKFVTHDMYAAGHPPLSGFEVETFLRAMPPHWKPLGEKDEAVRTRLKYDPDRHNVPQSTLLSGVLAMRNSVEMLAAQTSAGGADPDDSAPWPDFAAFDCYACHHELESPAWRQKRGYAGRPGRPPLHFWPAALVDAGIAHAAADSDGDAATAQLLAYRQSLTRLSAAVAARPFGDPAAIGNPATGDSASGAMMALLDDLAGRLQAAPTDGEAALGALRSLTSPSDGNALPPRDYASARQIAWAIHSIYDEIHPKPPRDAAIRQLLTELSKSMQLSLPNQAAGEADQPASAGIVENALPRIMDAMSEYDPQWFNEQLEALHALF